MQVDFAKKQTEKDKQLETSKKLLETASKSKGLANGS